MVIGSYGYSFVPLKPRGYINHGYRVMCQEITRVTVTALKFGNERQHRTKFPISIVNEIITLHNGCLAAEKLCLGTEEFYELLTSAIRMI